MTPIRFHRAATEEAEAAIRWYDERVAGLGSDFRAELFAGLHEIAEAPLAWPACDDDPRARRRVLSRFPYSIVYVVAADKEVIVVAIAHGKRRPGYWRERVHP